MAPEQLAGEKGLDARADVYALAVVGYEMLAGKPPFSRPTMQALVAAHMSEPPPPLSEAAPDVPPVISTIIEKALAKSPDDRYRTAAEFRDALDIQMTAAFQVVPRKPKVPRWVIVGGATVAGLAIAAAAFFATRSPKLDPDYVVVLPFNVQGADPTLSQDMVDMLQPIAAGWVKTVPADAVSALVEAVIARRRGERGRLGRQMGAGLAIYGTVTRLPHDSISVTATVYNVIGRKKVGVTHQRNGPRRRPRAHGRRPAQGSAGRAQHAQAGGGVPLDLARGGRRPRARSISDGRTVLQAVGVGFRRRLLPTSDRLRFDARTREPTCRGSRWVGFEEPTIRSRARTWPRPAVHNTGLPQRDSILVAADAMRASLAAFETDTSYYATVVRLFKTLRAARDSFPTDPEVWFALADAYFHYGYGPGLSVSEDTIRAAFDRSIALDSGFTPAYIHAIELAVTRDGRNEGLTYADRYLALKPTDEEADGIRALTLLLRDGGINAKTSRILDTLSSKAIQTAWLIVRRWPDSTEIATKLLQLPNQTRNPSSAFIYNPGLRRAYVVDELALRGRLREAVDTLGTNIGGLEAEPFGFLAYLGAVPSDTAKAVFARMLHDRSVWVGGALPWWAARSDTASLLSAVARADSQLAASSTPVSRRNAGYRVAATLAYLSLARHSSDALARFRALPDSLCPACYLDRYMKARLLRQPRAACRGGGCAWRTSLCVARAAGSSVGARASSGGRKTAALPRRFALLRVGGSGVVGWRRASTCRRDAGRDESRTVGRRSAAASASRQFGSLIVSVRRRRDEPASSPGGLQMKRLFAVVGLAAFVAACSDSNVTAPVSRAQPHGASLTRGDPPPPPLSGDGSGFADAGNDEFGGLVPNAAPSDQCTLFASFDLEYVFKFLQNNNDNNTVGHLDLSGPTTGSIDVHAHANGKSDISGHISNGSFDLNIKQGDGTVGFDGFNFSFNGTLTDLSTGETCKNTTGSANGSLVSSG